MNAALLLRAALFAAERHRDQCRKDHDESPYINHCIAVAATLADHGVDDDVTLAAALLHDTVEDTKTSLTEIELRFGAVISGLVGEVTDDPTEDRPTQKRLQVEHAATASGRAKLIKLADKIVNVRDVALSPPPSWTPARRQAYIDWAVEVVTGLRGTSASLEAAFDDAVRAGREELEKAGKMGTAGKTGTA